MFAVVAVSATLLPFRLSFAEDAMPLVIVDEMIPESHRRRIRQVSDF